MRVDSGRGDAVDHEPGDHVHADDERREAERDAATARGFAGGHHRPEIAPGQPRFVAREPDGGAGLDHAVTPPSFRKPRSGCPESITTSEDCFAVTVVMDSGLALRAPRNDGDLVTAFTQLPPLRPRARGTYPPGSHCR